MVNFLSFIYLFSFFHLTTGPMADEPTWRRRAAIFFNSIFKGKFANTYQSVHPGVTLMYLAGE